MTCGNYLFFAELLPMSDDMEPFYNMVPSVEGDIFKEFTLTWPLFKKTILKGLWDPASALKEHAATKILQKILLEVAEAVASTKGEGIRFDWIDRKLERLSRPRTTIDLYKILNN